MLSDLDRGTYMQKTNTKGFATIELLLAVAVVLVLGVAGVLVYNQQHKAKSDTTTKSSTNTSTSKQAAADPYAGWKSYTTKYDKLSVKYPDGWSLVDSSTTQDTDVTPGQDAVTLTSNDGLQVSIGTGGTEYDGGNPSVKLLLATPITMLGGTHYLVFSGSDSTTGGAIVTTANAVPSMSNLPASKNVKLSGSAVSGLPAPFDLISLQYSGTEGTNTHYPTSKFTNDSNYKTAISILASMTY